MVNKHELFDLVAHTGQALANGKRLEILELLDQRPRGVNELAAIAGQNVTTVSAHLQVLREAGLVISSREGTGVTYALTGGDVSALLIALLDVAERNRASVRAARDDYLPKADTVTTEDLERMGADGTVVVLDVRPADEFAVGHLEDAINIPVAELAARVAEIPAHADVVVYCRGRYCPLSHEALGVLRAHGHSASILPAGVADVRAHAQARIAS